MIYFLMNADRRKQLDWLKDGPYKEVRLWEYLEKKLKSLNHCWLFVNLNAVVAFKAIQTRDEID